MSDRYESFSAMNKCFGNYNNKAACLMCNTEALCIKETFDLADIRKKIEEAGEQPVKRISKEDYYLGIALAVSKRSNCLKRHYGCVIIKNDEIIATGYNGSPRGEKNCWDVGYCKRINKPHNSGDYSDCHSVHAEQNAMLSASRKDMIGSVMYLAGEEFSEVNGKWVEVKNCEPCPICERMIRNAGIKEIITKGDN